MYIHIFISIMLILNYCLICVEYIYLLMNKCMHRNDLFLFEQDFPILCQTCLGENPYIRMVSLVSVVLLISLVNL